jgi:DNA-binding protein HU-beta
MTLDDIAAALGEKLGVPKSQAGQAIHGLTEILAEALTRGERVALPNFGALSVADRPARNGRIPRTGEAMTIPARKAVKFTSASALDRSLNGTS